VLTGLKKLGLLRGGVVLLISFLAMTAATRALSLWLDPPHPITVHVRWRADLDVFRRGALEQQLNLVLGQRMEGNTWRYTLGKPTTEAIQAIVQHPNAEDTAHLDRDRFRPEFSEDSAARARYFGWIGGGAGGLALLVGLVWLLGDARSRIAAAIAPGEVRVYGVMAAVMLCAYVGAAIARFAGHSEKVFGFAQIRSPGWLLVSAAIVGVMMLGRHASAEGRLRRGLPWLRGLPARLLLSLGAGATCWALRTHFVNSDGQGFATKFMADIPRRGSHVTHDEMWELWIHSKFWIFTNLRFGWSVEESYAVLSCAAGAVFVFLLLTYCLDVMPSRGVSMFALCLAAGYVQLLFGDVENYTLMTMWVMAYFAAAAKFLEGSWSVVWASILLAIALTFHLEAGFLLPSLAFLFWSALTRGQWRSAIGGSLVVGLISAGTLWFFHTHGLPITDIWGSHAFARGQGYGVVIVQPSREYYAQLTNLVFLLMPAWMLLVPLVAYRRIRFDAINLHLLVATVVMGVFVLVWRASLGVYNDWNLFAMAAIPVTLLVWRNVLMVDCLRQHPGPLVALYVLFLVHSGSWIVANHNL